MSFLNIHSVHHTHITYTNPAIDRKTSRYSTLDTLRILHNLREMEYDPTGRVAVIQQTDHRASNSTRFFNSFRPRIMCVVRNTNSTFGFCFSMSRIAATSM